MRVLQRIDAKPVVLIGSSMGGAVALQTAAIDPTVVGVVAVATFSDLRTIAFERAPFFASKRNIEDAFRLAEREAAFRVDDVSPVGAAARITGPVLLIHGAEDRETPPDHSRRVRAALRSPANLVIVPGAGHNSALTAATWRQIETWLDEIVPAGHTGLFGTGRAGLRESERSRALALREGKGRRGVRRPSWSGGTGKSRAGDAGRTIEEGCGRFLAWAWEMHAQRAWVHTCDLDWGAAPAKYQARAKID
jgi:predicted alpha/beta hydrolase family esterase